MFGVVILTLFYVLFPILVIWLGEKRFALVDKIGAVVICYAAGIVLGNIGILPRGAAGVQDIVSSIAIPIALPLMFFSLDVGAWARTSGRALLAFGLEVIAVVLVSVAGFFLSGAPLVPERGSSPACSTVFTRAGPSISRPSAPRWG